MFAEHPLIVTISAVIILIIHFMIGMWVGAWQQRVHDKELKEYEFKVGLCTKLGCTMEELSERVKHSQPNEW